MALSAQLSDLPAGVRAIGDIPATRDAIYNSVLQAAANYAPAKNQRYSLRLVKPEYEGPATFSRAEEKRAVLEGRSLGRRLRGTWELITNDEQPQVLDSRRVTLASVPHMTDRGTFILNGSEYTLAHQMRLRPGIFTRVKESGEIESHINVAKGHGHRYFLEPESGVFRAQFGQARLPLMPILKALGATDKQIRDAWGNELFVANSKSTDQQTIKKLYAKISRGQSTDPEEMQTAIRKAFAEMTLDPEVTKRTLGEAYDRVDPEVILATTRKLLRVYRNEDETDDRDALAYQRTLGPEDIFAERLSRAGAEVRKALWRATMAGNLQKLPTGLFEKAVRGTLLDTGLGAPVEEINTAELLDQGVRVTRMGEGGIPSIDSIPDDARMVQPSHLGYVDPVHTPEGGRIGVDLRLSINTLKGPDGRLYARFIDAKTGKPGWKSTQETADAVVAFPGELESGRRFVRARVRGELQYVPREAVDLQFGHMSDAFGPLASLVPLKPAAFGQRVAMGSRFIAQALPLEKPEAPFVQAGVPGTDKSFEEIFGAAMGAMHSPAAGTVVDVTPGAITVRTQDGQTHNVELYDHHPFNRKTAVHNTPLVRVGQQVQKGQLLASSNFTDDNGTTALGTNARVAYIPWKGMNYEDAIVVSKSFADRSKSVHMYQNTLDLSPGVKSSKNAFVSIFPSKYDRRTLNNYDANGIIKVGTVVQPDEPLILAVKQRQVGPRLGRRKAAWADASVSWEHQNPGVVTDVFSGKHGMSVIVKTVNETQVGDKFAGRYGDKGVVAHIEDDENMPTDSAGRPFEVLLNPLGIISRGNPAQMLEAALGKIVERTGQPYKLVDFDDDRDLREFVERELSKHGLTSTEDIADPATGRAIRGVATGNRFIMKLHHTAESKAQGRATGGYTCFDDQTEVLTYRGWLPWAAVQLSDRLATVANGSLTYMHPTRLICEDFVGELCCYQGRYVDYAVTPNHRMYVQAAKRTRGYEFIPAADIVDRCVYVQQAGFDPDSGASGTFVLPPAPQPPRRQQYGPEYEARIIDLCDLAELAGWWVSEGSLGWIERGHSSEYHITISQYERANPDKFKRIEQLLRRLPFRWHYRKRLGRGRTGFKITSKQLAAFFRPYCDGPFEKRIPREIMSASKEARQRCFDAMIAGDGSITEDGYRRYSTTYERLAADFQELALRIGLGACVRRRRREHRDEYACGVIERRTTAQLHKLGNGPWGNIPGYHRRFYRGRVYCATMPTGLLYVRRNGLPLLVGNSEGAPAKGGETGAKRIGNLEVAALLSHGAFKTLYDAKAIRGQRNEQYWRQLMSGYTPPTPDVPFIYKKFLAGLQGAGINPIQSGTRINVMAMTAPAAQELTGKRELRNAETVDWRVERLSPVRGGLFDESLTGGHGGNRWSYISLYEPLPNPVMEEPIRRLLGLTQKQFEALLAGKTSVKRADGSEQTGPSGIKQLLSDINVDREIAQARIAMNSGRRTARDEAVRNLQYLLAAKKHNQHPKDWMLDRIPVLPPMFRPVSTIAATGTQLVDDPNYLYKEAWEANKALKDLHAVTDDVSAERLGLYNAFKAVVGLGEPIQRETREQSIRGILKHIFGNSPKVGTVQRKLLSANVDLVGRAAITPNPNLDMDQVALPIDKAWTIYQPFVVRRLVRRGAGRVKAMEEVKNRTKPALAALQQEMSERPVIINRAPVLHRYGVMAFWPQLTSGHTMEISPLITKGFGADFDGDAMQFHVPSHDDAVKEAAEKLLPSRNLFAVSSFDVHYVPPMEYQGGLWMASTRKNANAPRVFQTAADAVAAYRRGEIDVGQRVKIVET